MTVDIGAALAAAFERAVRAEGLEPDPALRLLEGRSGTAPAQAPVVDGPDELGPLHEQLLGAGDRSRRGAFYTPAWLARDLVDRALPDAAAVELGSVVDPACGGGVFLLAAVERLVALGWPPADALARVHGLDVDPVAVAVSEAALWWWGARRGAPRRPGDQLTVADALCCDLPGPPGAVVGNPPFLGQLRAATTVDRERRGDLRARFGDAVRPYTDPAWLFALHAVEQVVPGGRVALVQPQSFLAARDAATIRDRIDPAAALAHTVVDDGRAFDANVVVCAPVLHRRPAGEPATAAPRNDWTAALADARGVPAVALRGGRALGDVADIHAGFRDEFYGMADAVREATDVGGGVHLPRLVTVGAIDPLRLLARPQRFAGRRWRDPLVDVGRLTGRAARWAQLQRGPKLLVATQTKVLEAVADPDGALVGSVPVLCIRPHDPGRLWHLLAAIHAPVASAWALRRTTGTALSADACKPTVGVLAQLPIPEEGPAWDRAAELAQRASAGPVDRDDVLELARAADVAYGAADPHVLAWWDGRRPHRPSDAAISG